MAHPVSTLGNPENMEFQSGRLSTNLFGELVQVWVFKHLAQKPDYANRKAIQLYRLDEDEGCNTGQPVGFGQRPVAFTVTG